ncbi:hypothetical protein [Virgibacillus proomii]|uniref:hypothetical protein n=1 Tax=Virgibacillus proomii TaxID=84407 RepID=UPI001C113B8E|nr:hypothetical protein [Virgibacillus proomii]MBU5266149.1 hypothetical protein [Virgibacillus proomii]
MYDEKISYNAYRFSSDFSRINWYGFSTPTNDLEDLTITSSSKPVVFLLIDTLMDEPLQKAMEEGRAHF